MPPKDDPMEAYFENNYQGETMVQIRSDTSDELLRMAQRRRNLNPDLCRLLREQADLHQADIARALGVSAAAVSRWESGTRRPQGRAGEAYLEILDRLAREVAPLRRKLAAVDDFANVLLSDPGETVRAVGLALKSVLQSEGELRRTDARSKHQ